MSKDIICEIGTQERERGRERERERRRERRRGREGERETVCVQEAYTGFTGVEEYLFIVYGSLNRHYVPLCIH